MSLKFLIPTLSFFAFSASAQTIDVDSYMSEAAQPTVDSMRQSCSRGGAMRKAVCTIRYPTKIQFSQVSFSAGEVRKDQLHAISLPDETITSSAYVISNCTSGVLSANRVISISKSATIEVVKDQSLKTTRSRSTTPKLNLTQIVNEVSGLSSTPITDVSFQSQDKVTDSILRTYSMDLKRTVEPYQLLLILANFKTSRNSADFVGDIYLEGTYNNSLFFSKLVTDSKITVSGTVNSVTHELAPEDYLTTDLDPSVCQASGSQVVELTDGYIAVNPLAAIPTKTFTRFTEYTSVTVANVVSNLRVRVRQLGGSASCRTSVKTNSGYRDLFVPATNWSSWETVSTLTQTSQVDISLETDCDNPIEAEVAYWK